MCWARCGTVIFAHTYIHVPTVLVGVLGRVEQSVNGGGGGGVLCAYH